MCKWGGGGRGVVRAQKLHLCCHTHLHMSVSWVWGDSTRLGYDKRYTREHVWVRRAIFECQCDERLKTKVEQSCSFSRETTSCSPETRTSAVSVRSGSACTEGCSQVRGGRWLVTWSFNGRDFHTLVSRLCPLTHTCVPVVVSTVVARSVSDVSAQRPGVPLSLSLCQLYQSTLLGYTGLYGPWNTYLNIILFIMNR